VHSPTRSPDSRRHRAAAPSEKFRALLPKRAPRGARSASVAESFFDAVLPSSGTRRRARRAQRAHRARRAARTRIAFYPEEKRNFHFARKLFRASRARRVHGRPRAAAPAPPAAGEKYFCKMVDIQKSRD
jgi:hypothetical protein